MRIKQIDFGKTDANNEFIDKGSEKYLDSFYDYEKYNIPQFIDGKRYYICGNKGTGKTALLKYLEAELKSDPENLVFAIRFKSDVDETDRKELRKGGIRPADYSDTGDDNEIDLSNARFVDSYVGIWQVFLIYKLLDEASKGEYELFTPCANFSKLKCLLNVLYSNDKKNLIPKIKKGRINIGAAIDKTVKAEISGEVDFNETNSEIVFSDIAKAIIRLFENLEWSRTPAYVLIDELELSVTNSKARRQDIALVRDLIIAICRMNELAKKKEYSIHFIASIREEVISDIQVAGHEINKCIEDFGISISWFHKGGDYKDSPLLKMIERKIHASEKENNCKKSDDIWNTYFMPTINGEECRKFILGYSWMKPRDIVRMLNYAQEYTNSTDSLFTQEVFDRALQKYSSRAWSEICEELILNYSQNELYLIKELFTGIEIPFTITDISNRIKLLAEIHGDESYRFIADRRNLLKFLNIMYNWGIIGNTGGRMMFSFLGYEKLDLTGLMVIHRPLRNFFAVKSKK